MLLDMSWVDYQAGHFLLDKSLFDHSAKLNKSLFGM